MTDLRSLPKDLLVKLIAEIKEQCEKDFEKRIKYFATEGKGNKSIYGYLQSNHFWAICPICKVEGAGKYTPLSLLSSNPIEFKQCIDCGTCYCESCFDEILKYNCEECEGRTFRSK